MEILARVIKLMEDMEEVQQMIVKRQDTLEKDILQYSDVVNKSFQTNAVIINDLDDRITRLERCQK